MFKPLKSTTYCSYKGCKSQSIYGIKIFRMPRNISRQGPWRDFVKSSGRENADTASILRLCEFHFDPCDIEINCYDKKCLKYGALPIYRSNRRYVRTQETVELNDLIFYSLQEVMLKCSVPGCGNDKKKGFTLFSLPGIKELRQQWLQFLTKNGAKDLDEDRCVVCEEHFDESKIFVQSKNKTLSWDASPTINKNPIKTGLTPSTSATPIEPLKYTRQIPKCAIRSCKFEQKDLFISPEDSTQLMKWKEAADTNESEFYVCASHFVKNDLIVETSIKDGAIPKLYLSDDTLSVRAFDNENCGICFENNKHTIKVHEITDEQYTSFIEISGFTPLSHEICDKCKISLDKFKEFKTTIQTKHIQFRSSAKNVAKQAETKKTTPTDTLTTTVKAIINGVEKTLTIIKPMTSVQVKEEPIEEPMIIDDKFKCKSCSFSCDTEEKLNSHIRSTHIKKVVPVVKKALSKTNFECPKCPRNFDSIITLDLHLRESHKIIPIRRPNNSANASNRLRIANPSTTSSLKINSVFALSPQVHTSLSFKRIEDVMVKQIKTNISKRKQEMIKVPENAEGGQDDMMEIFEINEIEDNGQYENVQNLEEVNLMQEPTKLELKDENVCTGSFIKISQMSENIVGAEMFEKLHPSEIVTAKNLTLIKHKQIIKNVAQKREIPGDSSKHKCVPCGKIFGSLSNLVTHRIIEHRKKPVKEVIKTNEEIKKVHIQDHEVYKCDHCDKSFNSKDLIEKHLKTEHVTKVVEEILQCEICLKKFYKKGNEYQKHKETFHKNGYDCGARCNAETNAYQCKACKGIYFSLKAMRVHTCNQ